MKKRKGWVAKVAPTPLTAFSLRRRQRVQIASTGKIKSKRARMGEGRRCRSTAGAQGSGAANGSVTGAHSLGGKGGGQGSGTQRHREANVGRRRNGSMCRKAKQRSIDQDFFSLL